jgi:Uncharacterized alpha/beta hydrolase domain (DUF2235)
MARQLIVCCDGTNNTLTGRHNDTNVTQLCELLAPDANEQRLYYDPGVGNPGMLPATTFTDGISRRVRRLVSLAMGNGIYENIAEGYGFLMREYRPGDQIFLYGFSRGAFTARSIGGLINQFGLLRPEMQVLLPTLLHVYFSDRSKSSRYQQIAQQVNDLFCADDRRQVTVWLVGVWDTVASVGAPFFSREISATPTIVGKHYAHVRQALALDDHRLTFRPRPYVIEAGYDYAAHGQSIGQLWFPGSHRDAGGGYRQPESALGRETLLWMLRESCSLGLRLRPELHTTDGGLDLEAVQRLLQERSTLLEAADRMNHTQVKVHSETYTMPYWALAGLCVRDPNEHGPELRADARAGASEHPSVAARALSFPADTVWSARRPLGPALLALAAALFFFVLCGALLATPDSLRTESLAAFLSSVGASAWQALSADAAFARWQLAWWFDGRGALPRVSFAALGLHHVRAALWIDLGFIAAYGYLIGRVASRSFATVARLRRVTEAVPTGLNRLGLAACVLVVGDVLENLLTYLWCVTSPNALVPHFEYFTGALMSLASLVKWLGLLGCAVLAAWALAARRSGS